MDITSKSFIVEWDEVMDLFPINYTVRWYRGDDLIGTASVDGLSYNVTGLSADTLYSVTVTAVSTCCGEGPVSFVNMVTTNYEPTNLPNPTNSTAVIVTTTTTIRATPNPTPGKNIVCNYTCTYLRTYAHLFCTFMYSLCTACTFVYVSVCVCLCVCARACVRACVCLCV